jgi:hypothetical protein
VELPLSGGDRGVVIVERLYVLCVSAWLLLVAAAVFGDLALAKPSGSEPIGRTADPVSAPPVVSERG